MSKSVSVYLVTSWYAPALFRAKVDGFVPETQHVNLSIVGDGTTCYGFHHGRSHRKSFSLNRVGNVSYTLNPKPPTPNPQPTNLTPHTPNPNPPTLGIELKP